MAGVWRDHPWVDVVVAVVLAIALFNINVSSRGDALSSLERGERRAFYAVLAIIAAVLLTGLVWRGGQRWCQGCLAFSAAAGVAALLLDVQDGPVRTVQLLALVGLFLGLTATVRLVAATPRNSPEAGPRTS